MWLEHFFCTKFPNILIILIFSEEIIKLSTTGYILQENLPLLNLRSPGLPQSRLAWVPPSTQLHSGLARVPTALQQSAAASRLVPDILARGGGRPTFLAWHAPTRPWNQTQPPAPTQSTLSPSTVWFCHRVCVFCLSAFFFSFFFFNLPSQHADESRCSEAALHLCLSSEACWWCRL